MSMKEIKIAIRNRIPVLYMIFGKCFHFAKRCVNTFIGVFRKTRFEDVEYIVLRRVNGLRNGIYSNLLVWFPTLYNASDYGKKVVVDMQNYASSYSDGKGEINPWEFWYDQPACDSDVTLDDVLSGKAGKFLYWDDPVLHLVNKEHPFDFPWKPLFTYDKSQITEWNRIYTKYVRYTEDMREKVEAEWNRICEIKGHKKVLGVKFRGSDYRPEYLIGDHPHQVTAAEMVEYCQTFINMGGGTSMSILLWMKKSRWSYLRMLSVRNCYSMIVR